MFEFFPLFFLGLFFFWTCPKLSAQNKYVDSLKEALDRKDLPDLERVNTMILIGENLSRVDREEAIHYYTEAFGFADSKRNNFHKGRALSGIGNAYYYSSFYDSAFYFYKRADSLFAMDSSNISRASAATNKASIGNIQVMKNDYESAVNSYLNAIRVMEGTDADNKWLVMGILYGDIANVYHDMGQYEKALDYDLKALFAQRRQKDNLLNTAFFEIYVAGDYADVGEMAETKLYLEKVSPLAAQIGSADVFYYLYSRWGDYYKRMGNMGKAISFYRRALTYSGEKGNKFQEMNIYMEIGISFQRLKQYNKSLESLRKSMTIAHDLRSGKITTKLYGLIAEVESHLNMNADAVKDYQRYIHFNDSINKLDIQNQVNNLEIRYQTRKREDSILVLEKNGELQSFTLRKNKTVTTFLIVGCGLLLLVGGLGYNNFKRKNELLRQSEELNRQRIAELERERQIIAMQAVLKGQEDERGRLARDLHDGVGGLLSGIKLSLTAMKGNVFLSEKNALAVKNVINQLDQSIAELRRVSHNMMPEALIKYGLKEALENYCESLNLSSSLSVQLQTYGMDRRMDQNMEIVLYRIVQELLNNVIKHAEAKHVLVQMIRELDRVSLTVEDDGRGFDPEALESSGGAGLSNVQARVDYINGTLDIRSVPGEGTSVNIEAKDV